MSLKKTPLYEEHIAVKAKMLPFAGFEMPISYDEISGGTRREHLHVREASGIFDVSHMGEFWVEGSDAIAFLSLLTTKDFESSKDGRAYYCLLTNQDGGIIDDIIVYRLQEERFWVVVNSANIEKDWKHFQSAVSDFNVQLKDVSNETALIAIQGPTAEECLEKLFPKLEEIPYYGFRSENGHIIARTGYTGEDGFEVFLPVKESRELWKELQRLGALPIGLGARDTLRMEVGFPLYGQELTDSLWPHETLSAFAVRNKKNFLGSSVLTNAPRWKAVGLLGDSPKPMRPHEKILKDGEIVGELTSGSTSPILRQGMGLGLIQASCGLEEHSTFMLESGGKQREAKLISLPFVETRRVKKRQK